MPDWYYWKSGQGYVQQEFVEHKREEITGLTYEQICEIEYFKELVNNVYVDWIQEFIFMSEEDEKDGFPGDHGAAELGGPRLHRHLRG